MSKEEIKRRIILIISSLGDFNQYIDNDTNFFAEKIFDSMIALDYLIRIDEEFQVSIDMEIMQEKKLGKISDLTDFLFNELNSK